MSALDALTKILDPKVNIFIQTHNNPDPDAIACAFALKNLLKYKGLESIICYEGTIEKYSTKKMIELLTIEISFVDSEKDKIIHKQDNIIIVDAQKYNSNISNFKGKEVACIDHHPIFTEFKYSFQDIRPEYGACSTILAEYFYENNIPIDEDTATALLYGLKMDTLDLSRGTSHKDIDMYCELFKKANIEKLNIINKNVLEIKEISAYSNAIESIKVYNNIGFANAGLNCPDSLLACVSDFLISIKEVEFSVVYSERDKEVKFSIRNEVDELDAGRIINKVLEGIGDGGGHKLMAGGRIYINELSDLYNYNESAIISKFLESIKEYKNII